MCRPTCTVLKSNLLCPTVLCYTVPYCTVLCLNVLYYTVPYCSILYLTVLYRTVGYCTIRYCTAPYSSEGLPSSHVASLVYLGPCTVRYFTLLYLNTVKYCAILQCSMVFQTPCYTNLSNLMRICLVVSA